MRIRTKSKSMVDPTATRLSEHFLLSDFLGNHSVYARGFPNLWEDPDGSKLREGQHLCDTLLEPIMADYGPLSVSYGYISPALSKKIVTYQDPNAPSYHRWDKGAAADIRVHAWVEETAPIYLAHEIDQRYGYSRMITYSESPFICIASQVSEGVSHRRAFYENRYCGKKGAKPLYIRKSASAATRKKEAEALVLEHPWEGMGYPTYHGGGIRQFHHTQVSRYSVVSDFLYSTKAVCEGIANAPNTKKLWDSFSAAGRLYDVLLERLDIPRLSIVRGFESFRFNDYPLFSWRNHFAIDCIPPSYIKPDDVAQVALEMSDDVVSVGVDNTTRRVRIIGAPHGL